MASSQPPTNTSTSIQIDMDHHPGSPASPTGDSDSFVGNLRGRLSYAMDGLRRATEMMPNGANGLHSHPTRGFSQDQHQSLFGQPLQPHSVPPNITTGSVAASMLAHHHYVPFHTAVRHLPQVATATIGHNSPPISPQLIHIDVQRQREPVPGDVPQEERARNAPDGGDTDGAAPGTGAATAGGNQRNVESIADAMAQHPELRTFLMAILKTLPFLAIILLKVSYDKLQTLFSLSIICSAYIYPDEQLRKEIAKKHQKNSVKLCFYAVLASLAILLKIADEPYILDVILLTSYQTIGSFGLLIYYLLMADFCVKAMTVSVKSLLTIMPEHIIQHKGRGRIYLLAESVSQFYRCLLPIQPWLSYLYENYEGYDRIFGGLLVVIYTGLKLRELIAAGRFVRQSFTKFKQDSNFGSTPSSDELQAVGGQCPICHESFSCPIALECRHIFCDICIGAWFDRETTCPLCRKKIADDPKYRDGGTAGYLQIS